MTTEERPPSRRPNFFRLSKFWDVFIPIAIASVPAGMFKLLGMVTSGLDKPGAKPATWIIFTMIILQTFGTIAMALVVLSRLEKGRNQLQARTQGNPSGWRKIILFLSIIFLLLFDILTNVAAAFAGAEILVVPAVPAFFAYLLCFRAAFARL